MTLVHLLRTASWQELRHHPWRHAAALVAVMLGVALAFSVHLINASALGEFSQATRTASGQADLELRPALGALDENLYPLVARSAVVEAVSPVLELGTHALIGDRKIALRLLGIDALQVAQITPSLLPRANEQAPRLAWFAPATVFLNASAQQQIGSQRLQLQAGDRRVDVQVAGTVAAGGPPLAVMDLGAAQDLFGRVGEISRIDVRLAPGHNRASALELWQNLVGWPEKILVAQTQETASRISQLSRAYRVNLTVLALVALFTGAFLVFSVLWLGVAKRASQLALLGVLGLSARQRLRWVLYESLVLGAVGSAAGLALGAALAALGLELLGGDLGGGYFPGAQPRLQWSTPAALAYGALGVLAAVIGGWWPARAAAALPPAQTLKGLGLTAGGPARLMPSLLLLLAAGLLSLLPPVQGVALGAYLAVALLLIGGITALPGLIAWAHPLARRLMGQRALALLAIERAGRIREAAAISVSGVVAALSLAAALTIMVSSFRVSVSHWLDSVLPADLYLRSSQSSAAADTVYFEPALVAQLRAAPGVGRLEALRVTSLALQAGRPAVSLIARELREPQRSLPLLGETQKIPTGAVAVFVSEAMVDLYGAQPGQRLRALDGLFGQSGPAAGFYVAGIWRDYARQFGAIVMDENDYQRLTGDQRVNDLAIWLAPGADEKELQAQLRARVQAHGGGAGAPWLEMASSTQIRALSMQVFDRSFAVTYWLQAVAIGIGLFGVAASFSAQVLARRKEFGLLAHLGLTRKQILSVVAGEGLAWTAAGAVAGLLLGLAVALVLVHVINPQSFRWTMDLHLPVLRLAGLGGAVMVAGTLTAWLAGRSAASRQAVMAVKEDW